MSAGAVWSILATVVCIGFATETALGFGAMVVSLALGAQLVPLDELLAILVPLNLALSAYLAIRHVRAVDRSFLLRRLLVPVFLGVPVGLFGIARLPREWSVRAFGGFVVLLATSELIRSARRRDAARLSSLARVALLVLGGAIHGAFVTGGPLIVYVVGRELPDKHAFRATLATLWTLLGLAVLASLAWTGRITPSSLSGTALLALPAGVGLFVGELVHRRFDGARLRLGVFLLLLLAGALLLRG